MENNNNNNNNQRRIGGNKGTPTTTIINNNCNIGVHGGSGGGGGQDTQAKDIRGWPEVTSWENHNRWTPLHSNVAKQNDWNTQTHTQTRYASLQSVV